MYVYVDPNNEHMTIQLVYQDNLTHLPEGKRTKI